MPPPARTKRSPTDTPREAATHAIGSGAPHVIRILLAEDQAMVRGALSALLGLESDLEVLGAAADGEIAWRELQRLQPDVLVPDIEIHGLRGLQLYTHGNPLHMPPPVCIFHTFPLPPFP